MTIKKEVNTLDDSGMKTLCSGRDATNQEKGRASQEKALPVHRKEPVQAGGCPQSRRNRHSGFPVGRGHVQDPGIRGAVSQ